jgi:hypothetical protein
MCTELQPPGGYPTAVNKYIKYQFFFCFIKPSADDPALLTVDGHYSHTKNLDVLHKAKEHIVSLPQHSKHKMQPLDVGFMKSLKCIMHKKLKHG